MKTRIILLTTIVILSCGRPSTWDKAEVVGIWQNSPNMGSGWSDAYLFFDDGKFAFKANQMICDKRELSYSGTWEIVNSTLQIIILEKITLEGGDLVEATGSCASDFELVGAEPKVAALHERKSLVLSAIDKDKSTDRSKMKIGDNEFWKIMEDPAAY
jgi:hypothetical protein